MASKSKLRKISQAKKQKNTWQVFLFALVTGGLALYQNRYGQFSDIRGFYSMHFSDGLHHWPFSTHTLIGTDITSHPVEYPALTGLIMWMFSFFIKPSEFAVFNYYQLTSIVQIILFAYTTYLIAKVTNKHSAILFAVSPAVLYSLNRNWDIWAVVTLILSITLFENQKFRISAIALGISIATKFFPLILLLPITIYFIRKRNFRLLFDYLIFTFITWITINLPFALVNLEGWFYFYKFNYLRGLGSASIYEILKFFGLKITNEKTIYFVLNIFIFTILILFLSRVKNILSLKYSGYISMFCFMLFNKQYSMQYVIWLTSLGVLALHEALKNKDDLLFSFFGIWQLSELLFQFSFFQRILTNTQTDSSPPVVPQISNTVYAWIGIFRYSLILIFTILLCLKTINSERKTDFIRAT